MDDLLLDTNVVIAYLKQDASARQRLLEADRLFVPVVVAGELRAGVLRAAPARREIVLVEVFLAGVQILNADPVTAWHYASVWDETRARGRPIPENDLWIAATARQHAITPATRDAHFAEIESLRTTPC